MGGLALYKEAARAQASGRGYSATTNLDRALTEKFGVRFSYPVLLGRGY